MNPDQPSREEIEARITALLLGELPDDEAELLCWTISQNAELQTLHDRLKYTIGFMHEAVKPSADAPALKEIPLKLSPERRQKLLAHFKTPRANKSFWLKRIEAPTLIPVLVVLAIVALLVATAVPNFVKARSTSQANAVINNMRQIDGAKQQWALENKKSPTDVPTPNDLTPYLARGEMPKSVAGETYVLGRVSDPVTTDVDAKQARKQFGSLVGSLSGGRAEESLSHEWNRAPVQKGYRPVTVAPLAGTPADAPPAAAAPVAEVPAGGIVLPQTELPPARGNVYSQTAVGYTANPNDSIALTTPSESLSSEKVGVINGIAGGSSGGGGAGGTTTANRTTLAWDVPGAGSVSGKVPSEASDHGVLTGGSASRSEPAKGLAENGAENVPVPGDMPLSGPLIRGASFQQQPAQTENGAATSAGTPMQAAMLPSASAGGSRRELSEPDSAAPALSGNNSPAGGVSGAIEPKPEVAKDGSSDANGLRTLNSTVSSADSELSKSPATPPAAPHAEKPNAAPAVTTALPSQSVTVEEDKSLPATSLSPPVPQPEILTRDNVFSTFSLNVSDVSFKLAAASLEKGRMPDAASIRSEEFINAFDYRDPEAAAGQPLAFIAERARYPFAHNRELLRFSIKTAAAGRQAGRSLNLVLLLDTSGSMERADRVVIIREALRVLAAHLQPQDTVSVVTFARTARLWADGVPGDQAGEVLGKVSGITPEGGTNLEEAMRLAYETARRHYLANGINRVVMLTDGAANLGNVDPNALKQKVEANRKQGIALDCFGIGWEGYNDDLLEQLSSNGDGRYAFMNSPDEAAGEFAAKLAGALQVAAQDVKVQVEFNPQRVVSYRQIGYAKHQLTKEQFRDNTVAAGEIAAQEAGNALYTIETKPDGAGPIATVRVRYRVPGTPDYRERSWDVDSRGKAPALEQSSAAMRLAATASAFSEWLASSPFAQDVTPDELLNYLSSVPEVYGADPRPKQLEWMIRQAKSMSGK